MSDVRRPLPEEVEQLLLNARLRDELEPFFDESIDRLNVASLPTPIENEFLASMLAWERAPVLPIHQWYDPPLVLPHPDQLDEAELSELLWDTVYRLYEKRIVLDFTDHLTDRALYTLIRRDILPAPEKKIDGTLNFLHWDCANAGGDPQTWLRYYASEDERSDWAEHFDGDLPEMCLPPYPRMLPREPSN